MWRLDFWKTGGSLPGLVDEAFVCVIFTEVHIVDGFRLGQGTYV
jgi:hypothetical protein